jgi:hypothetical protein
MAQRLGPIVAELSDQEEIKRLLRLEYEKTVAAIARECDARAASRLANLEETRGPVLSPAETEALLLHASALGFRGGSAEPEDAN